MSSRKVGGDVALFTLITLIPLSRSRLTISRRGYSSKELSKALELGSPVEDCNLLFK